MGTSLAGWARDSYVWGSPWGRGGEGGERQGWPVLGEALGRQHHAHMADRGQTRKESSWSPDVTGK